MNLCGKSINKKVNPHSTWTALTNICCMYLRSLTESPLNSSTDKGRETETVVKTENVVQHVKQHCVKVNTYLTPCMLKQNRKLGLKERLSYTEYYKSINCDVWNLFKHLV